MYMEAGEFVTALRKNIPWEVLSPEDKTHITYYLIRLIKAEKNGELIKTIKEIKRELERKYWLFEYSILYNCLLITCEQLKINLE